MKTALSPQTMMTLIHWHGEKFIEQSGKLALAALVIPIMIACYWQFSLISNNDILTKNIGQLQKKLQQPLPYADKTTSVKQHSLSITEYQQVKVLFEILQKNNLKIQGSHYRFDNADDKAKRTLTLDIPLQGEWLALNQALKSVSRLIPVTVNILTVTRNAPESSKLNIHLQLILRREA